MREVVTGVIDAGASRAPWLRKPLVGFADAASPLILNLRDAVSSDHLMPEDILPGARIIISYFLPYFPEMGEHNMTGNAASRSWALAYIQTNRLIASINTALIDKIEQAGYQAAVPRQPVFDPDRLVSCWSERHIARAAGLGTFGLNNMLITPIGSLGRFGSVVTTLDVEPDRPMETEFCLYKINGSCKKCVVRCINGALTLDGFDRQRCFSACQKNKEAVGADVCGKCTVEVPCAVRKTRC